MLKHTEFLYLYRNCILLRAFVGGLLVVITHFSSKHVTLNSGRIIILSANRQEMLNCAVEMSNGFTTVYVRIVLTVSVLHSASHADRQKAIPSVPFCRDSGSTSFNSGQTRGCCQVSTDHNGAGLTFLWLAGRRHI